MRKIILELGPIVLGYGCVIISIIGIIKDIVIGDIADMTLPLHVLLMITWSIVSVKWTIEYRNRNKDDCGND